MEKAGKSAKTLFKLKKHKTQIPGICLFPEQLPGISFIFLENDLLQQTNK